MAHNSIHKERARNIVLFFVQNSKQIRYTKLFKLIFLADRIAYLKTGRTLTEYRYFAKPQGPVPLSLEHEIKGHEEDKFKDIYVGIASTIRLEKPKGRQKDDEMSLVALPGQSFNEEVFTPCELDILADIFKEYGHCTGAELSTYVHQFPSWEITYADGSGDGAPIDLNLDTNGFDDPLSREERMAINAASQEISFIDSARE